MVQTWWNHYWALSKAMLRILAFFQKLCSSFDKYIPLGRPPLGLELVVDGDDLEKEVS